MYYFRYGFSAALILCLSFSSMACDDLGIYEAISCLSDHVAAIELYAKIMMWSNFCYFVVFLCFAVLFFWRMIRGGR